MNSTVTKHSEVFNDVRKAQTIFDDMIAKAEAQGVRKFNMLFTVKDGLSYTSSNKFGHLTSYDF